LTSGLWSAAAVPICITVDTREIPPVEFELAVSSIDC